MARQALASLQERRQAIRVRAEANRLAQPDKDELSRVICAQLAAQPEYAAAQTVMFYVDAGAEVRTRHYLPTALRQGKRLVVPYCVADELALFVLESLDELARGRYGIPEPRPGLRGLAGKQASVADLDLVVVPGVAFDRRGARLGHGLGYYDRLLAWARRDTALVALAFTCQIVPAIPTQPHDVFMDKVITEQAIYQGQGRGAGGAPTIRRDDS